MGREEMSNSKRTKRVKKTTKGQINRGIRMSVPDMVKLASSLSNTLIARHGLEQALVIARLAHQKVQATKNVQDKRDKGEIT